MVIRVKICGLTRPEDAAVAARAGASSIGMVFWPESPRCVSVAQAREIVAAVPDGVTCVGVFVDQPEAFVAAVASQVPLQAIQLHGEEDPRRYDAGLPVIKALRMAAHMGPAVFERWPDNVLPLLDADDPERRGGTGTRVDWTAAAALAAIRPLVLAGGLTPENVAEAVRLVAPHALDVSSGVESAFGRKDHARVRAFLEAVRQAGAAIPGGLFA